MADVDELKRNLDALRENVNEQFSGVREDIKELTAAFRELIRMDGDLKRVNDAMSRIGKQVDDHEERLRRMENGQAADSVRVGTSERMFWIIVTGVVGVVTFFLTH